MPSPPSQTGRIHQLPALVAASLTRCLLFTALSLGAQLLAVDKSHAQEPSEAEEPSTEESAGRTNAYDQAIAEAVDAYGRGEYEVAREAFQAAHTLSPNARTERGLGIAAFALGDYAEAARRLTLALESSVVPLGDELRQRTLTVRDQALERVAIVRLQLAPDDAQVEVDGLMLGHESSVLLTPGTHRFRVWNEHAEQRATLILEAGAERTLDVVLQRPEPAAESAPDVELEPQAALSTASVASRPRSGPMHSQRAWWAGAAVAYGTTLLAFVPWGLARARLNRLTDYCAAMPAGGCDPSTRNDELETRNILTLRRAARGLAVIGLLSSVTLTVVAWRRHRRAGRGAAVAFRGTGAELRVRF